MALIVNIDLGFEEVQEGNRVITEFIKLFPDDKWGGFKNLYENKYFPEPYYHSAFQWLMPVVDKIERLGYDTSVVRKKTGDKVTYSCKIRKEQDDKAEFVANTVSDFKITAVWNAVIKFCSSYEHVVETK